MVITQIMKIVVLSVFFIPILANEVIADNNLLLNPGLESGSAGKPSYWSTYYPGTQISPFSWPETGRIGGYSAAINFTLADPKEADFVQNVGGLNSAYTYMLSGWLQIQNMTGSGMSTAIIKADWYTSTGVYISTSNIVPKQQESSDWVYFSKDLTIPSNAVSAHIVLQLKNATGKVWFDDIYFAIDNSTSPISSLSSSTTPTNINWTWINPTVNFNYTMIYINSVLVKNSSNNYYNLTGLQPNSTWTISTQTVSMTGMVNTAWVNQTTITSNGNTLSISSLSNNSGQTYINWTWTNPTDYNFNYTMIYINSVFVGNTANNYYNITGLPTNSTWTISTQTVSKYGIVNSTWINLTSSTTPPYINTSSISSLSNITTPTTINWSWTNPKDYSFDYVMIYINSLFAMNTSNNYYSLTGLQPNYIRMISIQTVSKNGIVNETWVNQTTTTPIYGNTSSISSLSNNTGTLVNISYVNWTWVNPADYNFNYTMIYINSVFVTNTTNNYYNITGLRPNSTWTISTHTVNITGMINTTWVNQTTTTPNYGFISSNCDPSLWNHVWGENQNLTYRLLLNTTFPCVNVTGIVESIGPEEDGDYHIYILLDSQYSMLLAPANYQYDLGYLTTEPICASSNSINQSVCNYPSFSQNYLIKNIHVGDHISMTGAYVADLPIDGHTEIHPITSIGPAILNKTSNRTNYRKVGDSIQYTYKITNTGYVVLSGFTVTDNMTGTFPCGGSILPGQFVQCTMNYTVVQSDINNGTITTSAYASALSNGIIANSNLAYITLYLSTYNDVSGYVFDNRGSGLGGVLVQNGSTRNTTLASGYYLITGLLNGNYNFSYSRPGFNTGYLEVTVNGADNTNANMIIYDITPPTSVSNTASAATNFYINNSWTNPMDADFNYTWFRYSNGTNLQNISSPVSYLNITWSPHYTQNISAQTVDNYNNINQTEIWFNATIPNNPPVQSLIGNRTITAGSLLQFNVTATDADSDPVTYGTNATNGTLNSTTGAYSWQTSSSDVGTYTWYFNSSDNYGGVASETITVTVTAAPPSKYVPPAPSNLTSTQGNFWINNSWQAGAGNATDSYNVSVNGNWTNGTTNTYYNNTVGPHGWSNITVWAYNNSDGGSLSSAPVMQSTQVVNNAPLQTAIGNKFVDGGQWLNFTVSAIDTDNDTIIYGTNATKGSFDITTGNFSWLTTYSDVGTYVWYFNSSDSYGGIASETITITVNNTPLSIASFSPLSDPTTIQGTAQTFNITLNKNTNITWYMSGTQVQTDTGTTSANYTNSTAETGTWNVTANATDGIDTVSRTWNWSVNAQPIANYVPSVPTNLQNTSGNFWVNHTWQAGAGNTTDSYNISVNGTWYNGTTDAFKNSTTAPHGWVNITVWAYNSSGTGSLSPGSISQDMQVVNNLPSQNPIGNKSVDEGQLLTFKVNATDADNDIITYDTNAMKGSFNTTTGDFSWIPAYGDAGTYTWYFNSSDDYGGAASEPVTVTVNNTPLSITSSVPASDPTITAGTLQAFEITLNRTANISWYIDGSAAQTNSSVASADYTNSTAGAGIYNVTAIADDGYDSASRTWNWTIVPQPVYAPGIISWSNSKTNNGSLTLAVNTSEPVNFNVTANQTITTWNWYQDDVNQNNNYDNFTASWNAAGTKTIQVNATNSNGTSDTITWTVTALAQPVAYIPPSPANITSITGNFWVNTTWQPGAGNITDSYNVSVNGVWTNGTTSTSVHSSLSAHAWQNVTVYAYNASGGGSLSTSSAIQNTQIPDNPPAQSPIGAKYVDVGQWLNFTVNATDADNDLITYGTNATKGSFNATTGNFSWLTMYSDAGVYVWYFNSSDSYGGLASETITVTINNVHLSVTSFSPLSDPTTIQGTAQTFNITLNRTANVTWYMNGAQVQTDIGVISASYTNSTALAGTWNVTASATDDIDMVSRTWSWTVNAILPATYIPADPTNLQSTSGNFWVNNMWMPGTGNTTDSYNVSVNGTWHNGITNTYYNNTVGPHGWSNITVWAYNSSGTGSLSQGSISQNTQVPNNPPVQVQIGNKNVTAGDLLTFTVSTTDADNDTITYGTNASRGTFNTTTGNFSWTYGDAGVYVWYFNSSDGYGGVASETITITVGNAPLSITSSSPAGDPTTIVGTPQTFGITLNRIANVTWYINDSIVQTNSSTMSADYTNFTVGTGKYNVTAIANDSYYSTSRTWNWTVIAPQNPAISLNKTANRTNYSNIGDIIQYTYNVTNIGDVTLSGLNITDNKTGVILCGSVIIPGQSTQCTANYTVGQSDINNISVNNIAIASTVFNGTTINSNIANATVTWLAKSVYNISGNVFDNYGAGLGNVLVQNGSYQNITSTSGKYSITNLSNGMYNFSYSKAGFNNGNLIVTIDGADNNSANLTIYDTIPPVQITGLTNDTPTQTTINLSWNSIIDANYYQIFRNGTGIGYTNNTYWNDTNLVAGTLYQYSVRANDSYNNWGLNSTVLNVNTAYTNITVVNLLKNPGFESGTPGNPNNWAKYPGTQTNFSYPELGRIGGYSTAINFTIADSIGASWVQSISGIDSTRTYQLSGWMKVLNVSGSGGGTINVDWYNSNWVYISTSSISPKQKGTFGWTYLSKNLTVPSNAVNAHIVLQLVKSTGKVWFDDMSFNKN